MRAETLRTTLAMMCIAACHGSPAHAASVDEDVTRFFGMEATQDAQDEAAPAAPRFGGVAELRGLWLRPGAGPTGHAQQAGLRLTLEQAFAQRHTLVAHAQGQWLHSGDAGTLQRLRAAEPATDRAHRLAWQREGPRQRRSAEVDWLYVHGPWQHGRYSVGRQPINPSLGRLWSAVDLFAPFHPSDLERLYKPGVDAAQLQWYLGERLQSTTIVSAARREDAAGGERLHGRWQQRLELEAPWGRGFVLAGTRRSQKVAGGGVQFNGLAGQDVYAELLWHHGPLADPAAASRSSGIRALLGSTRKLGENTLGTLEWLHQSRGTRDPARYDAFNTRAAALDLPYIGTGRHYLGASVSARVNPK